jgi:hypothetical protein
MIWHLRNPLGICALIPKIPELVGVGAIGELRVDPENA